MNGTSSRRSPKRLKKTFPREGGAKLRDTVQKLRARVRYLEKKNKYYETHLLDHIEIPEGQREGVRKAFLRQFRASLKGRRP